MKDLFEKVELPKPGKGCQHYGCHLSTRVDGRRLFYCHKCGCTLIENPKDGTWSRF